MEMPLEVQAWSRDAGQHGGSQQALVSGPAPASAGTCVICNRHDARGTHASASGAKTAVTRLFRVWKERELLDCLS